MSNKLKREELFNLLFDNRNEPDSVLIKEIETYLSSLRPYDHTRPNVEFLIDKSKEVKEYFYSKKTIESVSEEAEFLEKKFSKRDMAFLCTLLKFKVR